MERAKLWVSLFIVFIMVMSTAGFVLNFAGNQERTVKYNGVTFKVGSQGVSTKINGQQVWFNYLPQEVEEISTEAAAVQRAKSTLMLYMTSDRNSSAADYIAQAEFGFAQIVEAQLGIYAAAGFTEQTETAAPVVTCANATVYVPVIHFKESNETRIGIKDNCIIAEAATASEFLALKDRLLYGMLAVMS
jgi:hypothetical protein